MNDVHELMVSWMLPSKYGECTNLNCIADASHRFADRVCL